MSYENRVIDLATLTSFQKEPSLEVDHAWHQLLKCAYLYKNMGEYQLINSGKDNNIVVQKEHLEMLNRSSVLLRDGSGYLAGLDVFHELHCLVST